MQTKNNLLGAIAALALMGGITATVQAEEQTSPGYYGYGMGPGMMRGWGMGPGMMGGDWEDWHRGRGMMGYGMGPGHMWGQGPMMGPGMMGGWGYGPGGYGLNLNDAQQKKMAQISDDLRKKHWDLMGKMNDEYAKLRDLYSAEKRDIGAIDKQLQRVQGLQRQMTITSLEAQSRMEAELTAEQKKQLRGQYGPGWMMQ